MSGELELHKPAPSPGGPGHAIPAIIATAGEDAVTRFFEFFTANIRNANTRRAYFRNALSFLRWCEARGITDLKLVKPIASPPTSRSCSRPAKPPSVKQHLADRPHALRLARRRPGRAGATPPPRSAGPSTSSRRARRPSSSAEDDPAAPQEPSTATSVVGLRDRALIAVMVYSFARVGAAVAMRGRGLLPAGTRWWLRLHEKGGKHHEMPAHHNLEEYLDAYIEAAGIAEDKKGPLFRTAPRRKRRADPERDEDGSTPGGWSSGGRRQAGIRTAIGCHSFRATGITNYLENGGTLEKAQQMAAHESAEDDQALRPDRATRSRSTRSSGSRSESRRPLQGNHGRVTRSNEDQAGATLPEHHERAVRRPRPCCAPAVAPLLKGFNRSQVGPSRPA